jgi:MFS family permease
MAGRRPSPGSVLAVVSFGVFIAADDLTVASTMLRQIIGDLDIALPEGFDEAAWIVNGYLVAYVAVMPFMGRLSDVLGRRTVYLGALTVFLAGSIWVPLADDLPTFLVGRVLTAVGGGALVPVAIAVIGDVFAEARRPRAYGVLTAIDTIGWVWGPLFGALLVRYLTWRWQFYLNIPLALGGIVAAWWVLRDLGAPGPRRRIDWPAALSLSVALVALNVALLGSSDISTVSELSDLRNDVALPSAWVAIGAALSFALFLWLELRSRDPIIDLRLFRHRNLRASLGVNFLVGATLVVAMVDVPLFVNLIVETDLERAAVASGWVLSALTATMAAASYAGGLLTERTWYRPVILSGLVLCVGGFLLMASWGTTIGLGTMALHLAVLGIGFGLVAAPTNAAAVDAVPAARRGVAGGLVILARLLGLAVGLSGLTAWFLHRFDTLRRSLVLPPVEDPGYRDALDAARERLTADALGETFLFSAGLGVAAVAVAAMLRRRPSPDRSA